MDNRKRLPTPATVAPVPGTLRLGDRGSGGPVREGAPGGAALGVWGCKPLPGSALGAAGTAQAKRAGGYGRPLWGLFMQVAGAQPPHTRPSGL